MEPRTSSGSDNRQVSELPYIENGNRREYKTWFKLQVVAACKQPGASVSIVARQHNINTNVVFRWRREVQLGILRPERHTGAEPFAAVGIVAENGTFEPISAPKAKVVVSSPPPHADIKPPNIKPLPVPTPLPRHPAPGVIEMQLSGRIKIRIEGDVNKDALRRVLAVAREFA